MGNRGYQINLAFDYVTIMLVPVNLMFWLMCNCNCNKISRRTGIKSTPCAASTNSNESACAAAMCDGTEGGLLVVYRKLWYLQTDWLAQN